MVRKTISRVLIFAFLISLVTMSASATTNVYSKQTDASDGLFQIGTPHKVGQDFCADFELLGGVKLYLFTGSDTMATIDIRTDAMDETTIVASREVPLEANGDAWYTLSFDVPIFIQKGKPYALTITTAQSAIIYGKFTNSHPDMVYFGYNYDKDAYGGWVREGHQLGFELIEASLTPESVTAMIAALPDEATLDHSNAINAVRKGYDMLSESDQEKVQGITKLTAHEETIKSYIREEVIEVEAAIEAIGRVTKKSGNAIREAEELLDTLLGKYDELASKQMANLADLLEARAVYNEVLKVKLGDVDNNDEIQSTDALMALKSTVNLIELTSLQFAAADVNSDDEVAAADALTILKYSVGLLTEFKVNTWEFEHMLTEGNKELFINSYQSMLDRTTPRGYARTSVNDVYQGMFVRDTAIQIMAHIAKGDYEQARKVLKYTLTYHAYSRSKFALHIMNDLQDTKYKSESTNPNEIVLSFGEDVMVSQNLPDVTGTMSITAVDSYLSRSAEATGSVTGQLRRAGVLIDTISVPVEKIPENGGYVRFHFTLPFSRDLTGEYIFTMTAEDSPAGSIRWHGEQGVSGLTTSTITQGTTVVADVEPSYQLYLSVAAPLSIMKQTDTTYMLAHAWAQFVRDADKTEANLQFIEESRSTVIDLMSHYPDNGYIHENNLMHNPNLEHGREGRYWNCYDLITNVFASQAFHEMAAIDTDNAQKWQSLADRLANGIHTTLVTEVDDKTIYTELIDRGNNNRFVVGLAWVNFAPMAAEWYAMDAEIMQNTYDAYLKYGSVIYYGKWRMLEVAADYTGEPLSQGHGNHVIGKGLAWEILYNRQIRDYERLESLLSFVEKNCPDNMYYETWIFGGGGSDAGNQEQAAWVLYAMQKLFNF